MNKFKNPSVTGPEVAKQSSIEILIEHLEQATKFDPYAKLAKQAQLQEAVDYFRDCQELAKSTDQFDRYVFEFFNAHDDENQKDVRRPVVFDTLNQENIMNTKFVQSGMSVDTSFAPSMQLSGRRNFVCNKFFHGIFADTNISGLEDCEVSVDQPRVIAVCHVVRRVAGSVSNVNLEVNQRRQELIIRFDVERALLVGLLVEMTALFMQDIKFHISIIGSACELRFNYDMYKFTSLTLSSNQIKQSDGYANSASRKHEKTDNVLLQDSGAFAKMQKNMMKSMNLPFKS